MIPILCYFFTPTWETNTSIQGEIEQDIHTAQGRIWREQGPHTDGRTFLVSLESAEVTGESGCAEVARLTEQDRRPRRVTCPYYTQQSC